MGGLTSDLPHRLPDELRAPPRKTGGKEALCRAGVDRFLPWNASPEDLRNLAQPRPKGKNPSPGNAGHRRGPRKSPRRCPYARFTGLPEYYLHEHVEYAHRGKPKSLGRTTAVRRQTCMYLRQEPHAGIHRDMRGTRPHQFRYVATLVPIVKRCRGISRSSARRPFEIVKGPGRPGDGTLAPCWSYEEHQEPVEQESTRPPLQRANDITFDGPRPGFPPVPGKDA